MKFTKPPLPIPAQIAPGTGWHGRLWNLLRAHPYVDGRAMGFPVGWENEAFWKLEDYSI